MNNHAPQATITLASLCLLWGCERSTGPVAPDTGDLQAARSAASTALVGLTGGMNTATDQTATVNTDSRTMLVLYTSGESFATSIDLVSTRADADAGLCTVKNSGGDLGQFLVHAARGNFGLRFDKTQSVSTRHQLGFNWLESGVRIRVKLKGNISGFPPLTVTTRDLGGGRTEYTYSGGAVNVERVVGGVKQFDELFCLNRDAVVATVTR